MVSTYEKLANELNENVRENLQLRMEQSSTESAVHLVTNQLQFLRDEEHAAQNVARAVVANAESGMQAAGSEADRVLHETDAVPGSGLAPCRTVEQRGKGSNERSPEVGRDRGKSTTSSTWRKTTLERHA